MKWRSLYFLFTCLVMQKLVSGQNKNTPEITVKKTSNGFEFKCENDYWFIDNEIKGTNFNLTYKDENSGEYTCGNSHDLPTQMIVKFRTCDNCIELNMPVLSAVIVGNLLATLLIACAVYNITGQPKGKNFSGNQASDKVNLIPNGDRETYQQLTPGQNSEYSGLVGVRKK